MAKDSRHEIEDLDEELQIITMVDDETGEEVEFVVIDSRQKGDNKYLLVVESEYADDDEAEAAILKVTEETDVDVICSYIESDEEFEEAASLFDGEDYEVEY